jgi:hypothetical protein
MAIAVMVAVSVMMTAPALAPIAAAAAERGPDTDREMALLDEWAGGRAGAVPHVRSAPEGLGGC